MNWFVSWRHRARITRLLKKANRTVYKIWNSPIGYVVAYRSTDAEFNLALIHITKHGIDIKWMWTDVPRRVFKTHVIKRETDPLTPTPEEAITYVKTLAHCTTYGYRVVNVSDSVTFSDGYVYREVISVKDDEQIIMKVYRIINSFDLMWTSPG